MTPTPARDIRDAAALLASATDVTILGHIRPDADALGSALALGRALLQRGAKVRVSFGEPDEAPETLRWLDEDGLLTHPDDLPASEPLLVCVDTPTPKRLGRLAGRVETAGAVLVVDHHATNTFYGTCHVVDETAEASAILVFRLLDELGAVLDEPIARGIYAGIVTDTSGFRRASPETHRMAARLIEAGVDAEAVVRRIVDERPFAWLPMLSSVLSEARLEPEAARGKGFVHAVVGVDAAGTVRAEEVESVVDVVRSVREAAVAAVLKQDLANPAQWQISLRSIGIDVSAVAAEFGGGGHRQAAGCTIPGTAEEVLAGLRAALERAPLL
ncbi:bifunctional oligoribonuclease/PAP phosphatase NrnA [Amycolatopsis sp. SID8362]|uniref:DHH family phosphoesterase n=1 Tax=Amycolatopsis sp. SID8362 TaxID=2690346 RepID=UPI00136D06ED|nr:bifunctional oligoribonuclease/PAP phosphatase NrnA [Amycolatopsis sp. SID8362]NBH05062.1 bifunctional oligoribonuclease/PAP phosphatase NrnA [Amycolatopsis sp. SID8362]NED41762.1 bifunctional oligoribonuclease/PAP phosphatase NrnA [Amycolatopsis sp. SID8362]